MNVCCQKNNQTARHFCEQRTAGLLSAIQKKERVLYKTFVSKTQDLYISNVSRLLSLSGMNCIQVSGRQMNMQQPKKNEQGTEPATLNSNSQVPAVHIPAQMPAAEVSDSKISRPDSTIQVTQLQHQLQERDKTIEDYTAHLKRLQADFENFMKRTTKERAELQNFGASRLMAKLLNTLDDFERALNQQANQHTEHTKKDSQKAEDTRENISQNTQSFVEFQQGMNMVFQQFKKTLHEEGLAEIPCKGMIDPYKHEVLLQQPSNQPEGMILETLQKGYTFKNIVLRCAKVSIAAQPEEQHGKGKNHRN